jgi:ABC-2 type transport system ATP-binding protein
MPRAAEVSLEVTIRTRDLVKRFRTRRGAMLSAVDGVTLQVRRGETYGLIGPDGAGKTTTTRVILGLLSRTSGVSEILGYDSMRDTYAIRERVGYIAQQFALPADMTVMENMRFFADVQGVNRDAQGRRIPELLEFAGLLEFRDRLAGQLSGGMRKKLALACSLVHEPEVLMLDEPTLGVDPVSRREFWNMLGNLKVAKGVTIFVCTPYMDEAERCNWVGLMYKGKLVAHDSPGAIKTQVPGRLLEFAPSHFASARQRLQGMEGVLEVQTYGIMLHVFVDDPERRGWEIARALLADGITCEAMREIEPRMEEAFISLIRRQGYADMSADQVAREGSGM